MDTVINIRTDKKVRDEARKIFLKMGLSTSAGINLFLRQVIVEKGLPFTPLTENGFTPAQEKRILRETAYAVKHGKRYNSAEALIIDILK